MIVVAITSLLDFANRPFVRKKEIDWNKEQKNVKPKPRLQVMSSRSYKDIDRVVYLNNGHVKVFFTDGKKQIIPIPNLDMQSKSIGE